MKRWGMPLSGILLLVLLAVTLWTDIGQSDLVPQSASSTMPSSDISSGRRIQEMHQAHVRTLLSWQNPESGRFTAPGLIKGAQAQGLVYPLAVGWKTTVGDTAYRQLLLKRIELGISAALEQMDEQGSSALIGWDGKKWEDHHDPWLYLHLIRTSVLVGKELDPSIAGRFEQRLRTGCTQLDRQLRVATGHDNLLLVRAVALHCAGRHWGNTGWMNSAERIIRRVIAAQHGDGYWSEHQGPVVDYNFVYLYALGVFAGETHDRETLAALQRGVHFQYQMRYPDGTSVETPDERNFYRREIREGNIGFAFCDEGIDFISQQYDRKRYLWYYLTADLLNYRRASDARLLKTTEMTVDREFRSHDGNLLIRREGPWQVVISAYAAVPSASRWIMDRQNFFSIWRRDRGLVVGGGNTKGQPLWSSFVVGTGNGPESSVFRSIPLQGHLLSGPVSGVELDYGIGQGSIQISALGATQCRIDYQRLDGGHIPMIAQMTIVPRPGTVVRFGNGSSTILDSAQFKVSAQQINNFVEHNGVRLVLPDSAQVTWPVYGFNQYRQDGVSDMADARVVISLPLSGHRQSRSVLLEVVNPVAGTGQR